MERPNDLNLPRIIKSQYMIENNFLYQAQMPYEREDEIDAIIEV